jgi:hypothetical protein
MIETSVAVRPGPVFFAVIAGEARRWKAWFLLIQLSGCQSRIRDWPRSGLNYSEWYDPPHAIVQSVTTEQEHSTTALEGQQQLKKHVS